MKTFLAFLLSCLTLSAATTYPVLTDSTNRLFPGGVTNVFFLNSNVVTTGTMRATGVLTLTNSGNVFAGDGSGLTGISAGISTSGGSATNLSVYSSGTTNRPLRVFGTNGTSQVFVDKDAFLYVPTSVSAYGYGWANYSSAIGLTPNEGDHIVFYPGGNKVAQVRATGFGIMLEAGNPFSFVDNYNKVFGNSGSDGIEIVTSSGRGIANRTPVLASAFTGRAGTSSQSFNASGFVYVNTSEVGNIGTGEDDLISQTVAANALSSNGSSLRIVAPVVLAANANNKTIKAYWAGVSFYSTGALAINGDVAVFEFIITRTGATSQNITTRVVCGDSLMSPVSSDFDTGSATLSSANVFKLTGEATDDNDILNKQLTIEFLPSP